MTRGDGTGDWKVASTGPAVAGESLPYVGTGALPEPAFKDSAKMRPADCPLSLRFGATGQSINLGINELGKR